MANPDRIAALIVKGYTKPLDPAEQQELEAWSARSEENRLLVERLNNRPLLAANLKEYYLVLQEAGSPAAHPVSRRSLPVFIKRIAAAGSLLLAVVVGGWYWYQHPSWLQGITAPVMKTFTTTATQTDSLVLPDHTTIWLHGNSRCDYPDRFTTGRRELRLEGAAYFEVAKNNTQPFIVQVIAGSDTLLVTVLGTHFNIQSDPATKEVVTTVLQGSVNLQKGGHTVLLQTGEQVIASNSGLSAPLKTDTGLTMAWKNKVFGGRQVPIRQIMNQFKSWYGIEVEYYGAVEGNFSGVFEKEKQLAYNLRVLEATNKLRFTINGRTVRVISLP